MNRLVVALAFSGNDRSDSGPLVGEQARIEGAGVIDGVTMAEHDLNGLWRVVVQWHLRDNKDSVFALEKTQCGYRCSSTRYFDATTLNNELSLL